MRACFLTIFLFASFSCFAQWEEKGSPVDSLIFLNKVKETHYTQKDYHFKKSNDDKRHYLQSKSIGKIVFDTLGRRVTEYIQNVYYSPRSQTNRKIITTYSNHYHYEQGQLRELLTQITSSTDSPVIRREVFYYSPSNKLQKISGTQFTPGSIDTAQFEIAFEYNELGQRTRRIEKDSISKRIESYTYDQQGKVVLEELEVYNHDTLWFTSNTSSSYETNRVTDITHFKTRTVNKEYTIIRRLHNGVICSSEDSMNGIIYFTQHHNHKGLLKKNTSKRKNRVIHRYKANYIYYQ